MSTTNDKAVSEKQLQVFLQNCHIAECNLFCSFSNLLNSDGCILIISSESRVSVD